MDRRRVLLGVAAVIAVLGTLLVFVYVKGADARADSRYKAVQVLTVVKQIDAGEKVSAAQAAGVSSAPARARPGARPRRRCKVMVLFPLFFRWRF